MKLGHVFAAAAVAAALVLTGAPAAIGAERKPSVSVIASGLDNPRGIAVGKGGWLYVAEAGRGGDGPCIDGPEGDRQCLGDSAALTAVPPRLDRYAKPHRVITGLPSLANEDGGSAIGLHDISPAGTGLVATIGGAFNLETRELLGAGGRLMGHVVALRPGVRAGAVKPIADLNAYEARKNPDQGDPGSAVDSNPYGILATPFGAFATDAGGNDLLRVGKRGKVSTVATFPARLVTAPPIPDLPPQIPMQAVPTSVTWGPDGALYVGELTGFPFQKGAARVWRIVPGKAPTVYATGFTNIVDLAFDRRGRLLVLQISKEGLLAGDPNGALIRVDKRGGERTELAAGRLTAPGGVVVGGDGAIYVTNKSIVAGGGEVLRIRA
ncbi:ScyD/ScyE family protein [Phytohabitans sp. ZYX-F-186]|uniref:ScyD/ScyE family protein n=1 Tax=Phytohabitans maris TaxID=3071409 RepID=A0ABU0ZEJ3_9ACTN|nr:ScyD/ScyE family protein [Phytohabitans sp. ZYX-F-186]MDQ7905457.1 ScyD/ScyE family protein [Phytohabitans sp. ZYX-F-186]